VSPLDAGLWEFTEVFQMSLLEVYHLVSDLYADTKKRA
jgi:hypothetical protein